jgi:NTE family protein
MASACLPFMFKAVEIDGEAYWDGGYMGNPALFPLVDECDPGDLVLIQINPFYRPDIPQSARDIQNRLNEITFNAALLKELRSLAFLWEVIHHENLERERYRDALIHAIYDEETMLGLGATPSGPFSLIFEIRAEKPLKTGYRSITPISACVIRWTLAGSLMKA